MANADKIYGAGDASRSGIVYTPSRCEQVLGNKFLHLTLFVGGILAMVMGYYYLQDVTRIVTMSAGGLLIALSVIGCCGCTAATTGQTSRPIISSSGPVLESTSRMNLPVINPDDQNDLNPSLATRPSRRDKFIMSESNSPSVPSKKVSPVAEKPMQNQQMIDQLKNLLSRLGGDPNTLGYSTRGTLALEYWKDEHSYMEKAYYFSYCKGPTHIITQGDHSSLVIRVYYRNVKDAKPVYFRIDASKLHGCVYAITQRYDKDDKQDYLPGENRFALATDDATLQRVMSEERISFNLNPQTDLQKFKQLSERHIAFFKEVLSDSHQIWSLTQST